MKDKLFLMWLHERLELVHNEPANSDYMGKLRSIIKATPQQQETPNTMPDIFKQPPLDPSMEELHKELERLSNDAI